MVLDHFYGCVAIESCDGIESRSGEETRHHAPHQTINVGKWCYPNEAIFRGYSKRLHKALKLNNQVPVGSSNSFWPTRRARGELVHNGSSRFDHSQIRKTTSLD
jgi:hypothetical protein